MNTVTLGYLLSGRTAERVLVDARGSVYVPRKGWIDVPDQPVVRIGAPYTRPFDVPSAWLGGCPWWRR